MRVSLLGYLPVVFWEWKPISRMGPPVYRHWEPQLLTGSQGRALCLDTASLSQSVFKNMESLLLLRKVVYLLNWPPCILFLDERSLVSNFSTCHPRPMADCCLLVKLGASNQPQPVCHLCPLCSSGISAPALLPSALLSARAGLLNSLVAFIIWLFVSWILWESGEEVFY